MRIESTTYQVVSPDGTIREFDTFEEAAPAQAASLGSQLRTINTFEDVDARYGVMLDGAMVDDFGTAHEAAVFARGLPGSQVQLVAI